MTEVIELPKPIFLDAALGKPIESRVYLFRGASKDPLKVRLTKTREWEKEMSKSLERLRAFYTENFALSTYAASWEAVQNAGVHGSRDGENFRMYQYLCERGVASGIVDAGSFFRDPKVKEQFESRTPLREDQLDRSDEIGGRMGVLGYIYGLSDEIEVDTELGILWLGKII